MTARSPGLAVRLLPAVVLALVVLIAPAGVAASQRGSVARRLGPHSAIGAVTVLSNAKIVVAGSAQFVASPRRHRPARDAFAIAVFERDGGGLDRNFGRDGVVLTPNIGR